MGSYMDDIYLACQNLAASKSLRAVKSECECCTFSLPKILSPLPIKYGDCEDDGHDRATYLSSKERSPAEKLREDAPDAPDVNRVSV